MYRISQYNKYMQKEKEKVRNDFSHPRTVGIPNKLVFMKLEGRPSSVLSWVGYSFKLFFLFAYLPPPPPTTQWFRPRLNRSVCYTIFGFHLILKAYTISQWRQTYISISPIPNTKCINVRCKMNTNTEQNRTGQKKNRRKEYVKRICWGEREVKMLPNQRDIHRIWSTCSFHFLRHFLISEYYVVSAGDTYGIGYI